MLVKGAIGVEQVALSEPMVTESTDAIARPWVLRPMKP